MPFGALGYRAAIDFFPSVERVQVPEVTFLET
jgi:hypothetical protein